MYRSIVNVPHLWRELYLTLSILYNGKYIIGIYLYCNWFIKTGVSTLLILTQSVDASSQHTSHVN